MPPTLTAAPAPDDEFDEHIAELEALEAQCFGLRRTHEVTPGHLRRTEALLRAQQASLRIRIRQLERKRSRWRPLRFRLNAEANHD